MNSRDLTHEQFRKLDEALFRGVNYLVRLKTRMEKEGFPENDPLYVRVKAAYEASRELSRFAHSQSFQMGEH
jgi:hypothetical protein